MRKEYTFAVTVEFEDVDSYKIAHHTRLVAYLERARVHFLTSLGFDLYPEKVSIVLYSLEMRFKKPAKLLDRLEVTVFVLSLDDFRMELGYKIKRGQELLVRASSGIAFMDSSSQMLIAAPESYVTRIKEYLPVSEEKHTTI